MRKSPCAGQWQFLLTCLLRGMTKELTDEEIQLLVSTHMPLARHDGKKLIKAMQEAVSTHMPLARHDKSHFLTLRLSSVSTHMPLARHDEEA